MWRQDGRTAKAPVILLRRGGPSGEIISKHAPFENLFEHLKIICTLLAFGPSFVFPNTAVNIPLGGGEQGC